RAVKTGSSILCGRPTTWTFPDGDVITFVHGAALFPNGFNPIFVSYPSTITNNYGYRLTFSYTLASGHTVPHMRRATASNLAVSGGTASVSYGYDSTDTYLTSATNALGNITTYSAGFGSITPAGETSPTFTIAFGPS